MVVVSLAHRLVSGCKVEVLGLEVTGLGLGVKSREACGEGDDREEQVRSK